MDKPGTAATPRDDAGLDPGFPEGKPVEAGSPKGEPAETGPPQEEPAEEGP